ncbi:MAG: hypothetical protein ACP5FK_09975 [bacterium]
MMNLLEKLLNIEYWRFHRKENIFYLIIGMLLSVVVYMMIVLAPPETKTEFICMILGLALLYLGEVYFILVFMFSRIRK